TARTNLGLTTAATTAIGTSGATIPLLNANKTDTGSNSFTGALNTFNSGGGNLYVGASANVGGRHGLGVFYDGTDGRIDAVNAGVAFKNIKVDCATFIIQTGDFQGRSAVSVESSGTLTSASSNRIVITTAGVTINDGVHTANDQMLIYNNSASSVTITQDTGMTLRLDGTATTGNRTLGPRGKMHVFFNTNAEAICSGSGVS
ncbi:MAG: hypothetical protein EBR82_58810, partial [Caulobacteraceae bacterium]|nr:hypothetical protein [Caulobacteraceae bacterium]